VTRALRLAGGLGVLLGAATLAACTLVQSLDYLQDGDPDGGPGPGRAPDVFVGDQTKPSLLEQDATNLYWLAANAVMTVPKTGGTPRTVGMAPGATALTVDADPAGSVYLAVGPDVLRLPKDGSGGGVVFKAPAGSPAAETVIADDSALFVLQYDDEVEGSQVLRMAKDGGAPTSVHPDAGFAPSTLSAESTSLFWLDVDTTTNGSFVEHAKVPSATPISTFALGATDDVPTSSQNVAVDATAVYWATDGINAAPAIVARKREPNAPIIALYRGATQDEYGKVALDGANVYVIEKTSGSILRVPKAGGSAEVVTSKLVVPTGLVVDDTRIFVTIEGTPSGAVLSLPK
jgi:hypothetical protein